MNASKCLQQSWLASFKQRVAERMMFGDANEPLASTEDWSPEYDYATRDARRPVGVDQADARLVMIFDGRWKYIHVETMRPVLFDLQTDPDEVNDLGGDPAYADQIERLSGYHFEWTRRHHTRITLDAPTIEKMTDNKEPPGILIGFIDHAELATEGRPLPPHVKR